MGDTLKAAKTSYGACINTASTSTDSTTTAVHSQNDDKLEKPPGDDRKAEQLVSAFILLKLTTSQKVVTYCIDGYTHCEY